ncbi:MAG: dipeptidase [bacterium]
MIKYASLTRIFAVLSILLIASYPLKSQETYHQLLDCFSVVAGKDATKDGSVIFAHNEDTGPNGVNYYKVPRRKHAAGEMIQLRNGGKIPQVSETLGYIWFNIPGCDVCDSYINESGVAIGSDGCPSREDKPVLENGGIVFWLRRLVAERATTAREGVKLAGKIIEEIGYASSGRSYIIADPNEAWVLTAVNGKHWAARRVADDEVAVIANCYTMQGIDLSDTANYMGSADIITYATARGWYNPEKDGPFNFAKAYSNPGSLDHPGNTHRQWRGVEIITGKKYDVNKQLPFSVKPRKRLSVRDIAEVLRDHYEGTGFDKSSMYTKGNPHKVNNATICSDGTQYCVISQLRNWLPNELAAVAWVAPFHPDIQNYIPFYPAITGFPAQYADGDFNDGLKKQFDPLSSRNKAPAYLKFVSLNNKVDEDFANNFPIIKKMMEKEEKTLFKQHRQFEKKAMEFLPQLPSDRALLLTEYTTKKANTAYQKVDELINELK